MRAGTAARLIAGTLAALALAPAAAQAQTGYSIPPGNPFAGTAGARAEVYVYGMRNPYRWSFDRQTGDMYVGDVGGINEEITFIPRAREAGANLGRWDRGILEPTVRPERPPRRPWSALPQEAGG